MTYVGAKDGHEQEILDFFLDSGIEQQNIYIGSYANQKEMQSHLRSGDLLLMPRWPAVGRDRVLFVHRLTAGGEIVVASSRPKSRCIFCTGCRPAGSRGGQQEAETECISCTGCRPAGEPRWPAAGRDQVLFVHRLQAGGEAAVACSRSGPSAIRAPSAGRRGAAVASRRPRSRCISCTCCRPSGVPRWPAAGRDRVQMVYQLPAARSPAVASSCS